MLKRINNYLIIFLLFVSCTNAGEKKNIFEMTNVEIDQLLIETANTNQTITERMNFYSDLFLNMPYNLDCTGDGPYALYEPQPLLNFMSFER